MQISREQYQRFLFNQCSEEERLLFTRYLEQHPEVIDHLLEAGDWEKFETDISLHPAFSDRMRERFLLYMQNAKKQKTRFYKLGMAAVLSGLILLTIAWLLLDRPAEKQVIVKKQEASQAAEKWQVISNRADTISKIVLQDQSIVKLYAHSELRIKETPDPYKRDVFLQGTAHFTVTKDNSRPFTVYTSSVATTALGTAFTVKADVGDREVLVKLHEGKVVVRRIDTTLAGLKKDIYLLPGDQLLVSATGKLSLQHLPKKPKTTSIIKNSPVNIDALSFTNTPLADVLARLSQKFKIEIRYDAKELKAIFITASFTERDSLPQILDIICVLNNLRLQNSNGVFAVRR